MTSSPKTLETRSDSNLLNEVWNVNGSGNPSEARNQKILAERCVSVQLTVRLFLYFIVQITSHNLTHFVILEIHVPKPSAHSANGCCGFCFLMLLVAFSCCPALLQSWMEEEEPRRQSRTSSGRSQERPATLRLVLNDWASESLTRSCTVSHKTNQPKTLLARVLRLLDFSYFTATFSF